MKDSNPPTHLRLLANVSDESNGSDLPTSRSSYTRLQAIHGDARDRLQALFPNEAKVLQLADLPSPWMSLY